MIPIGSKTGKTALIIALTTLTITFGAGLSWESPLSDGKHINKSYRLEVTGNSGLSNVNFYFDAGNGWKEVGAASENSGTYYTDLSNINPGSVEGLKLKANTSDSGASDNETSVRTVTLDVGGPSVNSNEDSEYVKGDPEISFQVSDDYSDVVNASAEVSSPDASVSISGDASTNPNCNPTETCAVTFQVDTSELSNGDTFTLTVTATDQVGKTGSDSQTFTLDSSYDGDTSPDISLEGTDGDTALLDEGEDQQVNIDISSQSENTDITAECFVGGQSIGTDGPESPGDGTEFTCSIPGDEYSGDVEFEVELCDEAGNCAGRVSQQFTLDQEKPQITNFQHPEGVSTFNGDFDLSFEASDDASGISLIEYTARSDASYGEGIEIEAGSREFTVDTSELNLEKGENTVYIRAKDGAGRWSTQKSFTFEYYPNRNPQISLSAPERVEVKSDSSTTLTVTVENTGEFFIQSADISSSSDMVKGFSIADLEQGSSVQKDVNIDASELDVGVYNVTLSSSQYNASTTIELVVRATSSQQSSIEQEVNKWVSRMEELDSNVSGLGSLREENRRILEGNVSEFRKKVEKAQRAVESGEYYRAKSHLQNIEAEFQEASSTFSEVRQEYRQRMTNKYIMYGVGGAILLGGIVAGFLLYREEELVGDMDLGIGERLPDQLPELGIVEKLSELLGEEEEEEEVGYSFEDFT